MFDPTVFENLKIAFENQLYDLDNLTGRIRITGRLDRLDMAVLSRESALRFELVEQNHAAAEIRLEASVKDLAAEILEMPGETPGCKLTVRFYVSVDDVPRQCRQVAQIVERIWQPDVPTLQTLSFVYGDEPIVYTDTVDVRFGRPINEEQMGDIPELIEHVLRTLAEIGMEEWE